MSERYRAHKWIYEPCWRVLDGETGESIDGVQYTFAGALYTQNEKNNEADAAHAKAAAKLVCDCAEKLRVAEETTERFRHTLAQIIRYSDCRTARSYAAAALFIAERMKGGTS